MLDTIMEILGTILKYASLYLTIHTIITSFSEKYVLKRADDEAIFDSLRTVWHKTKRLTEIEILFLLVATIVLFIMNAKPHVLISGTLTVCSILMRFICKRKTNMYRELAAEYMLKEEQ